MAFPGRRCWWRKNDLRGEKTYFIVVPNRYVADLRSGVEKAQQFMVCFVCLWRRDRNIV